MLFLVGVWAPIFLFFNLYVLILTWLSLCRDLLYKPIVLCKAALFSRNTYEYVISDSPFFSLFAACGHICCFWCVYNSMNCLRESQCPVCRNQYYHFPTVCQLLHFLLLKIYTAAYKRRENQTLGISLFLMTYAWTYWIYMCNVLNDLFAMHWIPTVFLKLQWLSVNGDPFKLYAQCIATWLSMIGNFCQAHSFFPSDADSI